MRVLCFVYHSLSLAFLDGWQLSCVKVSEGHVMQQGQMLPVVVCQRFHRSNPGWCGRCRYRVPLVGGWPLSCVKVSGWPRSCNRVGCYRSWSARGFIKAKLAGVGDAVEALDGRSGRSAPSRLFGPNGCGMSSRRHSSKSNSSKRLTSWESSKIVVTLRRRGGGRLVYREIVSW